MGYHRNTVQAFTPRLTSSTHMSSKVIQAGFSPVCLLGFAFSQNPGAVKFLYSLTGLSDHFPCAACLQRRIDVPSTEVVGGDLAYLLRDANKTIGQIKKMAVGRVKDR